MIQILPGIYIHLPPNPFYSFATILKYAFLFSIQFSQQFLQWAHTSPYSCKVRRDGFVCFHCLKNLLSKMSSKTFFPIPPYYWIFLLTFIFFISWNPLYNLIFKRLMVCNFLFWSTPKKLWSKIIFYTPSKLLPLFLFIVILTVQIHLLWHILNIQIRFLREA